MDKLNSNLKYAVDNHDTNYFRETLSQIVTDKILPNTWKYIIKRIVSSGMTEELSFLIKHTGISLRNNFYSQTFLYSCTKCEHYEIIKILIEHGLDVNERIEDEDNYLIGGEYCSQNYEIVKLLLDSGANVKNTSALDNAVRFRNIKIIKLLLDHGADVNDDYSTLFNVVKFHDIEIVKLLIEYGGDVNMRNGEVFMVAIECGLMDMIKILLDAGVNIELYGGKAFVFAVRHGKEEIIELLINLGIDVNYDNCSALRAAIINRQGDMIKFLLKNGANGELLSETLNPIAFEENNKIFLALQESGISLPIILDLLWGGYSDK